MTASLQTLAVTVWACDSCDHIANELEYAANYCTACKDETVYNDVTERVCQECDELRNDVDEPCQHCGHGHIGTAAEERAKATESQRHDPDYFD